jgi:hypothetical protein
MLAPLIFLLFMLRPFPSVKPVVTHHTFNA